VAVVLGPRGGDPEADGLLPAFPEDGLVAGEVLGANRGRRFAHELSEAREGGLRVVTGWDHDVDRFEQRQCKPLRMDGHEQQSLERP
jgi:hypothetical protein